MKKNFELLNSCEESKIIKTEINNTIKTITKKEVTLCGEQL